MLITAVVCVALLGLLNLILMLGVLRRLRDHSALLADRGGNPFAIAVGQEIGEFETSTVDGEPISQDLLEDGTVVAFFSPGCGPCETEVPRFADFAETAPGGRNRLLAVIVGETGDATPFVSALCAVSRVVVEDRNGALSTAFRATAYPTVLRVGREDTGQLVVTANRVPLDRPVTTAA
ncbi:hypothetical protein GCM10010294_69450 [Streptomyces griseoloalbus]|nr:hypothetical protein GCM10010294_69450 [Streptomyces griseoloalbus]